MLRELHSPECKRCLCAGCSRAWVDKSAEIAQLLAPGEPFRSHTSPGLLAVLGNRRDSGHARGEAKQFAPGDARVCVFVTQTEGRDSEILGDHQRRSSGAPVQLESADSVLGVTPSHFQSERANWDPEETKI